VAAGDPALARDFQVIAVDQRGIGLSDKPADGYDAGTLAGDLVALMDALGHELFAVVGHDTIGGAETWGEAAGEGMKPAADDVQTVVIQGAGHWVAEQAPDELLAALTAFLAPYRHGLAAAQNRKEPASA
jgi:pimeloyl-ACP methyl ester carboxylesterase